MMRPLERSAAGQEESHMEISSVTSSIYSTTSAQAVQMRARQLEQEQSLQQAPPAQSSPLQQTNEAPTTQVVNEAGQSASSQSEAERNRPVVNTSGQLVGTRVNTTA